MKRRTDSRWRYRLETIEPLFIRVAPRMEKLKTDSASFSMRPLYDITEIRQILRTKNATEIRATDRFLIDRAPTGDDERDSTCCTGGVKLRHALASSGHSFVSKVH